MKEVNNIGMNDAQLQYDSISVITGKAAFPSQLLITSEQGVAAALEARRLSDKYGKDYFNCEDLMQITGIGMNNIRQLMCSDDFPTITIGNRKVVSSIAFVLWSLTHREAS